MPFWPHSIRRTLQRLQRTWHWFEDAVLVSLLAAIIVMATLQIILRNFFDTGLVWNESLLRILVLWLTLVGATVASRDNNHIAIDLGRQLLPPQWVPLVAALVHLLAGGLCLIAAYYTGLFVLGEYRYPAYAFAKVPSWTTALVMPASFGIMGLRFGYQIVFPVQKPSS